MDTAPVLPSQHPDRPIRRFPLNSIAGVIEDLEGIELMSGVARCDLVTLQATCYGLFPGVAHELPHGWHAACFIRVHIRRVCLQFPDSDPTDSRVQAAAMAMRFILLQPGRTPQPPEEIRREAMQHYGCTIALEDLSGIEQLVRQQIARAAYAAMGQRTAWRPALTAQTVEEVVYRMLPIVTRHRENVSLTMRNFSNPRERRRRQAWDEFLVYSLFYFVNLRKWCDILLALPARQGDLTRTEKMFVELAGWIQEIRFEDSEADRAVLDYWANRPETYSMLEFRNTLDGLPEGDRLFQSWWHWLTSCPVTCTYHRSNAFRNTCQAHRFMVLLEHFENIGSVLLGGG